MPYILLNAEGTVASKAGQSLTSGSLQAAVEKVSYKGQCPGTHHYDWGGQGGSDRVAGEKVSL